MLNMFAALALASQAAPTVMPPAQLQKSIEAQNEFQIKAAAQLLKDHQPQAALDAIEVVLAAYTAAHAGEKRRLYCGMSVQESLLYTMMAAKDKVGAVIVPPGYCTAVYLKGYALVDLGRISDAKAQYEQVIALAPLNAHFLTEFGQLSRLGKDWPRMLATCKQASEAALIASPDLKPRQQGEALRCQGFALSEEHRLDEAEKRYRDALLINPDDRLSQNELRYIAKQRAKN